MPTYLKVRMERHWGKLCLVCRAPITQKGRGRVRETCSHACREKLYRQRRAFYEEDRRRWAADDRRADAILSQWRREFGDLGEDEWRLRLRVSRGMPIPRCKECGKPYLERGANHQYCSARCRERAGERRAALRDAIYIHKHGLAIGREVYDRAARRQPYVICGACGLPFVRRARTGRMPKYCSKACRQAAHWRRGHKKVLRRATCPECGRRFGATDQRQRYCSHRCADYAGAKARRAKRAKTHFWGECIVCGARIEEREFHGGFHRQYCSNRCRLAADRNRRKQRREMGLGRQARRCAWCGKPLGWEAHGLRKYCGEACKGKAKYQKRVTRDTDSTRVA